MKIQTSGHSNLRFAGRTVKMFSDHLVIMIAALIAACITTSSSAGTLLVPNDYSTIQAAIDASVDGDEVVVANGIWTGDGNRDLDFGGRAITVRSEDGAATCIIDTQGTELDPRRAFSFHNGETGASVVEGFTIRNGFIDRGGAVLCENGSSPRFEACVFQSNWARTDSVDDGGGAVHVGAACSPTFTSCQFLENHLEDAFGAEGGGAIRSTPGSAVTLIGCEFTDNDVTAVTQAWGGAIYDWGGVLTLTGCTFSGNSVGGFGGGGAVVTYESSVTQTNCIYMENSARWAGAAWDYASVATYVDCTFTDNSALGAHNGGYQVDEGTTATMIDCSFICNRAVTVGGGIGVAYGQAVLELIGCDFFWNTANRGGGVHANENVSVTMTQCHFEGNQAGNRGGGVEFRIDTEATAIDCVFIGNQALNGGGGAGSVRNNAQVEVISTLFVMNEAATIGGGLLVSQGGGTDASMTVINSTFTRNRATQGGAVAAESGGHAAVANSVLWGDDAANELHVSGDGTASASYSCVEGGWPGVGNIDVDPLFVDPDGGDFHLSAGSPCIDAADNNAVPEGITGDLDGRPRFQNDCTVTDTGNGTGAIVDMGAYEAPSPDLDVSGAVDFGDVLVILAAWGPCPDPPAPCVADLDDSGDVGFGDLLVVLAAWGPCE
jgi:hypothetical protein